MGEDSWDVPNEWALLPFTTLKNWVYKNMESRIQTEGQALVITSLDLLS